MAQDDPQDPRLKESHGKIIMQREEDFEEEKEQDAAESSHQEEGSEKLEEQKQQPKSPELVALRSCPPISV